MPYKDLVIYIGEDKSCQHRIDAALTLAKRHGARLKAIAFALNWPIPSYVGVEIPIDYSVAGQELSRKTAVDVVAKFEKAAKKSGIEFVSEIIACDVSRTPAQMAFHARLGDITFIGQPDPDDNDTGYYQALLDGVLFASGRPVYAVPYIGQSGHKMRKAVVAWDGGGKAARAVNDAIPLLKDCEEVTVLVINPGQRSSAHGENPGVDIAAHLGRHGINATVNIEVSDNLTPATVILNYLSDAGADLLVMGAYGHSRLREWAFGGVTDSIMHQMTVPVFMSE